MAAAAQPTRVFAIRLDGADAPFSCRPGETVLEAMERVSGVGRAFIGVKRIPVGCRRGGCGVCRVQVVAGTYGLLPQSRDHVTIDEEGDGYALACRLTPDSDLTLRPAPKIKSSANRPTQPTNEHNKGGTPDGP